MKDTSLAIGRIRIEPNLKISSMTFPTASFVLQMASHIVPLAAERFHLENEVPEWTEVEMEKLYQSIFSSAVLVRRTGQEQDVSTYVNKAEGKITSIILFKIEDFCVQVLNELVALPAKEIFDFVVHIFTTRPDIRSITFHAIRTDSLNLAYPYQRYSYTEDIVIELPDTSEQYRAMLGKNMRKTIRQHLGRIERDFPSFEYLVLDGENVRKEHILQIAELNRARMSGKNKVSGVDENEIQWISECVRHFSGMAILAIAEGKVCAGQVCCRAGNHFFMLMVGHDPAWDSYRLGTLCQYRAICEVIERGGKACHFLWGREEYKYRFLGVLHDFNRIVIYSSHAAMLCEIRHAASVWKHAKLRQARLWLLDPANQNKLLPKVAKRLKQSRAKS